MKTAMQAKLGQQIGLTPQLLQSIRLLQLTGADLELEVRNALDSNPLLELDTDEDAEVAPAAPVPEFAELARVVIEQDEPEAAFERGIEHGVDENDEDPMGRLAEVSAGDFRDALRQQYALQYRDARDNALAAFILDRTGEAGYLEMPLDGLRFEACQAALDVSRLETVRQQVLRLQPAGIGAADLAECLRVQLENADDDASDVELALAIVDHHLDALGARRFAELAHAFCVEESEILRAARLIRRLDPRPAAAFIAAAEAVLPDVLVVRGADGWQVALNPRCTPRLRVHAAYERMLAREAAASEPMKEMLNQARWLSRGLHVRHETLLRAAAAIVARQHAFLERGHEALAPLTLKQIGEDIGVHESTISRISTGKFMHTPRGTFELKHFFAVKLAGATVSGAAVKAKVSRLIEAESPGAPLSDEDITLVLARQGIRIARRTVAKYRDQLHIPSARERLRAAG